MVHKLYSVTFKEKKLFNRAGQQQQKNPTISTEKFDKEVKKNTVFPFQDSHEKMTMVFNTIPC